MQVHSVQLTDWSGGTRAEVAFGQRRWTGYDVICNDHVGFDGCATCNGGILPTGNQALLSVLYSEVSVLHEILFPLRDKTNMR